ncbi:Spaetzle [Homalodisca vitripennis]|nr:Spaetzle [Homalodisca vitripennis]
MAVLLFLVGLTVLLPPAQSTPPPLPLPSSPYHCLEYGNCRQHYNFVPAPPGKTPPCASHGSTFCENTDRYPIHMPRGTAISADVQPVAAYVIYLSDALLYSLTSCLCKADRLDTLGNSKLKRPP